MSAPVTLAEPPQELIPGLVHWTLHDERIDFRSDAYALEIEDRIVVVDPLPLTGPGYAALPRVDAICLTGGFHQRAAWIFRERFGAAVLAPNNAQGVESTPDRWYDDGDEIEPGLTALHRPGPTQPHFALFWKPGRGRPTALFCADLLMRAGDGALAFVPDEHQDDPALSRDSVRRLLHLGADMLCPAHGAPLLSEATEAMRDALERDSRS